MHRFASLFGLSIVLVLVAATSALVPREAHAGVPPVINFQGVLSTPGGTSVRDSTYSVTFTIYNAPTGGTAGWTETQPITTSKGLFNALLGSVTPLPNSVFADSSLFLGIKVSPDPEMVPRQRLASVAYSNRISTVDGAAGGMIKGGVTIQGDTSAVKTACGVSPALTVGGGLKVTSWTQLQSLPLSNTLTKVVVTDPATGCLYTRDASTIGGGADCDWQVTTAGDVVTQQGGACPGGGNWPNNHSVCIGTTTPGQKLTVEDPAYPAIGIYPTAGKGSLELAVATCTTCYSTIAKVGDAVIRQSAQPGGDIIFSNRSVNGFRFTTGSTSNEAERVTITAPGDVGIGTNLPTTRTEIQYSDTTHPSCTNPRAVLRLTNKGLGNDYTETGLAFNNSVLTNTNYYTARIYSKYDGTAVYNGRLTLQVRDGGGCFRDILNLSGNLGGSVGINTTTPTHALCVMGDIGLSGVVTTCSDARYKRNVEPLSGALAKVLRLRGVYYQWRTEEFPEKKFSKERQVGFIAQEIKQVLPEVVLQDSDGYYSVDYSRVTPLLVEAVKELEAENTALREKVSQIDALRAQVTALTGSVQTVLAQVHGGRTVTGSEVANCVPAGSKER